MDYERQLIDDLRDDMIHDGELSLDMANWIEQLIEYKVRHFWDQINLREQVEEILRGDSP